MKPNTLSISRGQRGATLIEVLVAVLILSVGLLGVAALQAVSLNNNNNAYFRTQAVNLNYEFMDRIRALRLMMLETGMPSELLLDWQEEAGEILPGGTVNIAQNGDIFTVEVSWVDDRTIEAGSDPDNDARRVAFATTSLI